MKQDRRGSGSDRRRSAAAPDGTASRRSAGHADGSLGAEKKSYRQFNVGDRLESRDAENPRPSTVTAADYADFINSFGVPKKRSSGSSLSKRGVSRGKTKGHPRGRKSGDGTPVPGSQIKDIIRRQLPRLRVRLTASAIVSLLTGILIYHVFMGFYVEYKTEVVSISPYLETIDVEGYAILDEKVVSGTMSSTSVMTIQNGDKVSAGDPIVNIFSSESEARAYERVSEIDRELEVLMSMDNTSEDSASKVDLLSKQLDRNMSELNKAVENRNMTEVAKIKNDISYLLNKRLVAMRQDKDFNSKIESLQKEREELESQYSKQPDTINASDSGYFTDSCDGYEDLLNTSMVDDLTLDKLNKIMEKEVSPPEKTIGKLVGSFSWYLACPVSAIDSDYLIEDATYRLYLPYSTAESVFAVLDRIDKQDGQDTFLALFRCSSLASELCTVRKQPVKIEKCSYEGFAIPKSALHAGVREVTVKNPHSESDFPKAHLVYVTKTTYPSVYAIVAGQIREKEVSIVYGTDKLVICMPKNGDNFLSLGDTVVIAERGLYNGKLIG